MGFSDEDKMIIKNLHDLSWNSLWDLFNDTSIRLQLVNWQCWFCPYLLQAVWLVWLSHL